MKLLNLYFNFFDNLNISCKITIQIFFIILLTLFVSRLVKYILFLFFKYFIKSSKVDNSIVVDIKKSILFFVWLFCFLVCTQFFVGRIEEGKLKLFIHIRAFIVYISILTFLLKTTDNIKKYYILHKERSGDVIDYSGLDAVEKISKVCIIIMWTIFVLGRMGFNLNALLAFGGAGGIVVGFAGKDMFANIFGGLMIYLDKPFGVGDWIASPDREIEGDVEFIGWRQTRILTFEKFPIYIPNSIFSNIVIQNLSRIRSRRIQEYLNIRYIDLDKVEKISNEIKQMLLEHPNINKKNLLMVNFSNFTNGAVTLYIYTYTNTTSFTRFYEIKQDVLLKIATIIKSNGAEVAMPVNSVYVNTPVNNDSKIIVDHTEEHFDSLVESN